MQISIWLFSPGETPQRRTVGIAHPKNFTLGEPEQLFQQLLQPEVAKNVPDEINIRRQHTKLWYDRTAKALVIGQGVHMQPLETGEQWRKPTVIKKVGERSYLTQTDKGQVYRRNWKYLRVTNS